VGTLHTHRRPRSARGHPADRRTRRPLRYPTVRYRCITAIDRSRTRRVRRRTLSVGHPRPTGQRRPHTHTHSTRTQPAIRSVPTTTTSRAQVSHSGFIQRGGSPVPGLNQPTRFLSNRTDFSRERTFPGNR
jgi:hypothetical protein